MSTSGEKQACVLDAQRMQRHRSEYLQMSPLELGGLLEDMIIAPDRFTPEAHAAVAEVLAQRGLHRVKLLLAHQASQRKLLHEERDLRGLSESRRTTRRRRVTAVLAKIHGVAFAVMALVIVGYGIWEGDVRLIATGLAFVAGSIYSFLYLADD